MPFMDSLDVANRALYHCGVSEIADVAEDSDKNTKTAFAYDKLRRLELQRNVWSFATRRTVLRSLTETTQLIAPVEWADDTRYLPGAIVTDANGYIWLNVDSENINQEPGVTDAWEPYFGPRTVDVYDEDTTYFAGELVYVAVGTGGFVIFMSLQNNNDDEPTTATDYDATVSYQLNDVVKSGSTMYRSLIPINLGITPADGPLDWDETAIYAASDQVTGSDGYIYTSIAGSNTGYDPVTHASQWTATGIPNAWASVPAQYEASNKWRPLFVGMKRLVIVYPVGTGPRSNAASRNIFLKPAGWLRKAPQNPKMGQYSYLGGPSLANAEDWELEGNYIISSEIGPILYRFVADVTRVSEMHDMFCEGLACRIALAVCEPLTQSNSKLTTIAGEYKFFMTEARINNAIEVGSVQAAEDDWIACRR